MLFSERPRNLGTLLLLTGPTAAGKDSTKEQLIERNDITRLVSYTTRPPRQGETDGIDYNFVSRDQFQQMATDNKFLETNQYGNNMYATAKESLQDVLLGKNILWIINMASSLRMSRIIEEG